mgnify:CR=1 FL=1
MNARTLVRFANVIIVALLAGISLGIWIGFNPVDLSYTTYVEQQQNMLGSLRVLMVVLVFVATIITILAAFLEKQNKASFIRLLSASGFLIACILITRFGNKPIDDIVMTWTTKSSPSGWTDIRDNWWTLHVARTLTELIAFSLILWTAIKKTIE